MYFVGLASQPPSRPFVVAFMTSGKRTKIYFSWDTGRIGSCSPPHPLCMYGVLRTGYPHMAVCSTERPPHPSSGPIPGRLRGHHLGGCLHLLFRHLSQSGLSVDSASSVRTPRTMLRPDGMLISTMYVIGTLCHCSETETEFKKCLAGREHRRIGPFFWFLTLVAPVNNRLT
jgi:hypothetical protein